MSWDAYETKIRKAIDEADIFKSTAQKLLDEGYHKINESFDYTQRLKSKGYNVAHTDSMDHWMKGTRLSGEMKRRSMDLQKALVELRKP